VGEVERAPGTHPDEVGFVQGEAGGERGDLDEAGDAVGSDGREPQPVPAALDDLAEGAHGQALLVFGDGGGASREPPDGGGTTFSGEADRESRLVTARGRCRHEGAVDGEAHAARVVIGEDFREGRVEQGFEVADEDRLDEAALEER
jgi:hypothetical protein